MRQTYYPILLLAAIGIILPGANGCRISISELCSHGVDPADPSHVSSDFSDPSAAYVIFKLALGTVSR